MADDATPRPWSKDPTKTYSPLFYFVDGEQRFHTIEEAAALIVSTPRVMIRKSTAIARVNSIGKMTQVAAALAADPLRLFQWNAPDRPNVYADDAGLLAVLRAAKCSDVEIAAVTAPDPTAVP